MKRFLIVDDSAFTRSIHRKLLADAGYESLDADGGPAAMTILENETVDAILLDLLMPDEDGVELITRVRDVQPSLPILVCSADKQQPRQREALAAGATAFVGKPLNADRLAAALAGLFGNETSDD
jgi:CheY-like chemotaxis protein